MADTPRAILERARLRIFEPKNWTGKAPAESERGAPCCPCWSKATRWDAFGALKAEVGVESPQAVQAVTFLRRAAAELFAVCAHSVSSKMGHEPALRMYGRAMELAAEAEAAASRVGVARPAGGADDAADQVLGLDQSGRAADVRPGADEADRAHAKAFLHFLEHLRPELRIPLAERPSHIVKEGREHEVGDPLGLVDHFVLFLHDRYTRMAAGENVDEAAPASSERATKPSSTVVQRALADRALKRAHRVAARLAEQQHHRHADTAENALALMLATVEASHAFADAVTAIEALRARWEIG